MPEEHDRDPFSDGLGDDPIDHGSLKPLGQAGGGGGYIDPSYEDALNILGSQYSMPSPWEQRALVMDDPDAAKLAVLLTELKFTSGAGSGGLTTSGLLGETGAEGSTASAVEAFIAALQEQPPDEEKLTDLRSEIDQGGGVIQEALARVCDFPGVKEKIAG
jgi:hypothetical protein